MLKRAAPYQVEIFTANRSLRLWDVLKIAAAEVGAISEATHLPTFGWQLNSGLPSMLVDSQMDAGLNSGHDDAAIHGCVSGSGESGAGLLQMPFSLCPHQPTRKTTMPIRRTRQDTLEPFWKT
jgi:hypothetical protein